MEIKYIIMIILLVLCILLSAFFSCCDMAYSVANKLTLERQSEKGSKTAKLALKFCNNYDSTISTVVFSNNLVNIAASSITAILGTYIFIKCGVDEVFSNKYAPYICSVILMIIIIAFGEVTPKVVGRLYADKLVKVFAYPVRFFEIIFFPFVKATTAIGSLICKPFRKMEPGVEQQVEADDELQEVVDQIEKEGIIDESQKDLLKNAIAFIETEAHEIMTPRVDVFAFDIDENVEELISDSNIFEYSRVPIYEGSIDNVIGILPTKLLIREMLKGNKNIDIRDLMIKEINVPSGMEISTILKLFKKKHTHIAIVKDEFGGTEGILTLEDIVEELVGEIWDELDKPEEDYVYQGKNVAIVDGGMGLSDFFEMYQIDEESVDTDYDTVGGWCTDVLQKFPKKGDKFRFKNLEIEILTADEFTAHDIRVKKHRTRK